MCRPRDANVPFRRIWDLECHATFKWANKLVILLDQSSRSSDRNMQLAILIGFQAPFV